MKSIIPALLLALFIFFVCYFLGIGHYYIYEKKGAYYPELKYGTADIFIWHNGSIIYYEGYNWRPEVWEQDRVNHMSMAEKFIRDQK